MIETEWNQTEDLSEQAEDMTLEANAPPESYPQPYSDPLPPPPQPYSDPLPPPPQYGGQHPRPPPSPPQYGGRPPRPPPSPPQYGGQPAGNPAFSPPPVYPPTATAPRVGSVASPYRPGSPHLGRPWSSGVYDCGLNESNAVMTAFFPCVTFGQIAEILDEGETSCVLGSFMYVLMVPALLTCWIMGSNYRRKLRNKYNLVQAPAEDWTLHLFCPCCSLCQEYRELQNRGIDPSLGWMGYLANQQDTTTYPPGNQYMAP